MDIYTFYNTFVEAVAADTTLDAWSLQNFNRNVLLYPGALPSDDPEFPYIVLMDIGYRRNQELRDIEYEFDAWLAIKHDGLKVRDETNIIEYEGVELLTQFINYYQTAIINALPANTFVAFDGETDTISTVPQFHAFIACRFTEHLTIGSDPMT